MSVKVVVSKEKLDDIANAISAKTGNGVKISLDDMPEIVMNMSGEVKIKMQEKTVKSSEKRQVITPDEGYDGIDKIIVDPINYEYAKGKWF